MWQFRQRRKGKGDLIETGTERGREREEGRRKGRKDLNTIQISNLVLLLISLGGGVEYKMLIAPRFAFFLSAPN